MELTVEEVFVHAMTPFPTKITQSEKQYVLFSGNHYYYTPYTVKKQSTTVSLATSSVESHSKLKPTSLSDNAVTYGPYSDAEAFQISPMRVHFENNTPFLSVCTAWIVKCTTDVTFILNTLSIFYWTACSSISCSASLSQPVNLSIKMV